MLCYAVMLLPFDHGQQAVSLSEVETAMARQGPQTESEANSLKGAYACHAILEGGPCPAVASSTASRLQKKARRITHAHAAREACRACEPCGRAQAAASWHADGTYQGAGSGGLTAVRYWISCGEETGPAFIKRVSPSAPKGTSGCDEETTHARPAECGSETSGSSSLVPGPL